MSCILNQLKICLAGKGNMGTDPLCWKTVLSPLAEKLFQIQQLSEKKASLLSSDKTSQSSASHARYILWHYTSTVLKSHNNY
jgi:hypothetical protein